MWNQSSWSHNRLILNIDDENKRNFYLEENVKSNWSVRQLERQINSFYYERLLSTKKENNFKTLCKNRALWYNNINPTEFDYLSYI